MGSNIDREIVQLVFEAKDFRKGIQESIEQIENLKKSFDLTKAQESLASLEDAADTDFSPMAKSLDSINSKLSLMGVAAATMVASITQSVIDAGKKMVDALVLTPIFTGLEEYETQLNAVQTILANTKRHGTTLQDVTDALDELNLYADLTIYNFTQMTDSIGKFTTAGVDLDTSVSAIKGIANAAALSGSNAQQASTAMYQLSQAISSGTVRLQDWISVENAGMGGAIMQDALVETARVHGVAMDQILEKAGSFRNSLQEKWLTSDIMLETLQKFTGDLTEAQLESMGYTEDQIAGIMEMGQMANDAATKIKTLTQLKDTMAEAMQSGWGQTWRIIFGDFEEAKTLWGGIAEVFGGIIDGSSQSRNSMLEMWAQIGGRRAAIQSFYNIIEALQNILGAFGEAVQDIFKPINFKDLYHLTLAFQRFTKGLADASQNTGPFTRVIRGIAAAIDILRLVALAVLGPIWELVTGLGPATGSFMLTAASIGDAIVAFREFAIETDFFNNIVQGIIAGVGLFAERVSELIKPLLELEVVKDVIEWLKGFRHIDWEETWGVALIAIKAVIAPFYLLFLGAKLLYEQIVKLKVIKDVVAYFQSISWEDVKNYFAGIAERMGDVVENVRNSDLLAKFLAYFDTFDGRRFNQFLEDAKEGFSWLTDILEKVTGQMGTLDTQTADVGEGLGEVGAAIAEGLESILDYLIDNAANIDYSALFDVINTGLLAGLVLSVRSIASGGWLEDALGSVFGEDSSIGDSISGMFETMEGSLMSFQQNVKADTLQKVAVSIALLAGSIALMTLIDSTKLLAATGAIALMIATLFGSAGALSLIKTQDAVKASIAIVGLSTALAIVAIALKSVAGMKPTELEASLVAMAAGLAALVVSISAISGKGDAGLIKTVGLMLGLSVALKMLIGVIRTFGEMNPEVLAQGLKAVSAALGILVASMIAMTRLGESGMAVAAFAIVEMAAAMNLLAVVVTKFGNMNMDVLTQGLQSVGIVLAGFAVMSRLMDPTGMISGAIGITIMTASLLIMAAALKKFSGFSWEELQVGLAGMGASLLILVVAANLMTGALAGAAAMVVMGTAIILIAGALKILSSLEWSELAIALVGMAAIFVILGLAGLILAPLIPVILLLGVGMLLMGVAAALLGVGLLAAATGLVAIAGAAAGIAAGMGVIGLAITELLPLLGTAIAEAMVNFVETIAEYYPRIVEAMNTIVLGMIQGVATLIPEIVIVIMDMVTALLTAIAERLPEMLEQGYAILLAFLQGIADNVADIIATGLMIITEIINGIAEGIPDLIESAFNLILTFLEAIADAVEEYMPMIIKAGFDIGVAIIKGIVEGLWDGLDAIYKAIGELVQQAIDRFKAKWGIASPSKVTYEMAKQVVAGFVNGIRDKTKTVVAAFEDFTQKGQNGISSLIKAIETSLDDTLDIVPVIKPVLDLDNITAGASAINSSFRNQAVLASLTYEGYRTGDGPVSVGADGYSERDGVVFNQFNYSPKALDRPTIYRQTRAQIAQLQKREFAK
jgi:tape measure domain-containing protein